ncbi:MAG: NTP transferase domain-containing protein [Planctomycetota bacterium]
MPRPLAIVLAAGKGTRMESDLPKVLVPACGRPMIRYVLDGLRDAGVERLAVVVGYKAELVRGELGGEDAVVVVDQTEQLGTGHAVMMCRAELEAFAADGGGPVIIVTGDSPMLQASSVRALLEEFAATKPACLLGTAHRDDPTGLGRVVRDADGQFVGVVEEKDATPEQQAITEVNMSTYVFNAADLLWVLDRLTTNNAQAEYYITDGPGLLREAGKTVAALPALQPCEALSVNTVKDLAAVEDEMRRMKAAAGS